MKRNWIPISTPPKNNGVCYCAQTENPLVIFTADFIDGKFYWREDGLEIFPKYWCEIQIL